MKKHFLKKPIPKQPVNNFSVPIRIMDGIYIGDEASAHDIDFITNSKITHIINTARHRVGNFWETRGIQYLSFRWSEIEQKIQQNKNDIINQFVEFIDQALAKGQAILIHSNNQQSRSSMVVIAYFIKKYCWGLEKCLEFLKSKKINFVINAYFLKVLQKIEEDVSINHKISKDWKNPISQNDLILTNTFKNSKKYVSPKMTPQENQVKDNKTKKRVNWASNLISEKNIKQSKPNSSKKIRTIAQEKTQRELKSILKGFSESEQNIERVQFMKNKQRIKMKCFLEGNDISCLEKDPIQSPLTINNNMSKISSANKKRRFYSPIKSENEKNSKEKSEQIKANLQMYEKLVRMQIFEQKPLHQNKSRNRLLQKGKNHVMKHQSFTSSRNSSTPTEIINMKQSPEKRDSSGSRIKSYENVITTFKKQNESNYLNKAGIGYFKRKKQQRKTVNQQQRNVLRNKIQKDNKENNNGQRSLGIFSVLIPESKKQVSGSRKRIGYNIYARNSIKNQKMR